MAGKPDEKYTTGKIEDLRGPPLDGPGVLKGYRPFMFETTIPLQAFKDLRLLREALIEIAAIASCNKGKGNVDAAKRIEEIAQQAFNKTEE